MSNVIIRYEQKYRVSTLQAKALQALLHGHMLPDDYGRQTLYSLYFDTEDLAAAHGKELKRSYREKLRVRSYGRPNAQSTVYMELKKKVCGVSCKRRAALSWAEASRALQNGVMPPCTGQIGGEIAWFLQQHQPQAKAVLCYDRTAFYGSKDPALRLTLDENLRCRGQELSPTAGDWGTRMLPAGQLLMEIKAPEALPFWLAAALSQLGIYPCSFSKYQTAAQNAFYGGGNAYVG